MNDRQRAALERHCRFAFETMRPGGCRIVRGRFTVVLSVNSGWE
jgi:hypothetical protein